MKKREIALEINRTLHLIGARGIDYKKLMRCPKSVLIGLYGSLLVTARDVIEGRSEK